MNTKKVAVVSIAAFATFFVTDFLIHGLLLKSTYQATQQLWRPETEMPNFMPFMILGQMLISVFFSWIFLFGYQGRGASEGLRYGLLLSGFLAGNNLVMYSVAPYPTSLVFAWIACGLVQAVLAGMVCTAVADRVKA